MSRKPTAVIPLPFACQRLGESNTLSSTNCLFIGLSFYWHEANWFPCRRLVTALLLIVYAAIVTKPGCYRYKNRGLPLQNRPSSVIKAANLTKNLFSRLKRLSDKEIQSLNLFIAQLLAL
jgi:hypothetical protein